MELISGLVGMNLSMAKLKRRGWKKSPRMLMHKYAKCTVRIPAESGMKIPNYFKCHSENNWLKLLLEKSNKCNM